MWFRIELDKSGAILKCDQVDQGFTGTKFVRFVEAETKAAACSDVKAWYENRLLKARMDNARRAAIQLNAGLCRALCCKQPPAEGRTKCKKHLAAEAVNALRCKRGETKKQTRCPEKRKQSVIASGRLGGAYFPTILKKFDELGSVQFRAWLVSEIERRSAPEKET